MKKCKPVTHEKKRVKHNESRDSLHTIFLVFPPVAN